MLVFEQPKIKIRFLFCCNRGGFNKSRGPMQRGQGGGSQTGNNFGGRGGSGGGGGGAGGGGGRPQNNDRSGGYNEGGGFRQQGGRDFNRGDNRDGGRQGNVGSGFGNGNIDARSGEDVPNEFGDTADNDHRGPQNRGRYGNFAGGDGEGGGNRGGFERNNREGNYGQRDGGNERYGNYNRRGNDRGNNRDSYPDKPAGPVLGKFRRFFLFFNGTVKGIPYFKLIPMHGFECHVNFVDKCASLVMHYAFLSMIVKTIDVLKQTIAILLPHTYAQGGV